MRLRSRSRGEKMRRPRGFTLTEALVSILILSVMMILALTLLMSMRSFAAKQQTFTAPRQITRSAIDYMSFFLAGAADLNVEQGNPNALAMWTAFGKAKGAVTTRQVSFNNLTAGQAAAGLGDEGTDIITLAVPTNPVRIPIMRWEGNDVAGKNLEINFSAGCPSDVENLKLFKQATGMMTDGSKEFSGILTVQDAEGRWRYMQITNYNWSKCDEALPGGTSEVIHVEITPGNSDQLNPPGGWRDDLVEPFTINGGVDFTSFRVRNRNLEQKTSGIDGAGIYSPGIFNPDCDGSVKVGVCPSIGFTPVVENVEDLQIAYVFQDGSVWNTGAQVLATKSPDGLDSNIPEQAVTVSGVPGPHDIVNVRALRVSVIGRSNPLDIGARNLTVAVSSGRVRRQALEDHTEGPPDTVANGVFDRYRLTTTLLLRNRMLGF
jgi:prepilin-type N-terminal cleavage/methylation domain-containing protein